MQGTHTYILYMCGFHCAGTLGLVHANVGSLCLGSVPHTDNFKEREHAEFPQQTGYYGKVFPGAERRPE